MAQHTPQQYSVPSAAEDFQCGVGGSHEGEQKVEGLLGMGPPASTRGERKRLQSKQVHAGGFISVLVLGDSLFIWYNNDLEVYLRQRV